MNFITLFRQFLIKLKKCGKPCEKPVESSQTCEKTVEKSVEKLWISIRAGKYVPDDGE